MSDVILKQYLEVSKYKSLLKIKNNRKKKYVGKVEINRRNIVVTNYKNDSYDILHPITFSYSDFKKEGISITPIHSGDTLLLFTSVYYNGTYISDSSKLFTEICNWLKKGNSVSSFELYMGSYRSVTECGNYISKLDKELVTLYDKEAKQLCY